jgi:hypothetical protein
MKKGKLTTAIIVLVIVSAVLLLFLTKQESSPRPRAFIRSNGNVEPSSAPIQRNGNSYSFTGDVYAEFVVERSGIVIDGAGYTLHGPYNGTTENLWIIGNGSDQVTGGTQIPYSIGIDLSGGASGLTFRNLNIENYSIGTYIWTTNNAFFNNSVSECVVGVLLSGSENNITENYLARNEVGLFFGTNEPGTVPLNLTVSHNSFEENVRQLGGCLCQGASNASELIHTWDNGKEGNYWSDYNGTDANKDGIGDIPYMFDVQNEDRFPLMYSPVPQPAVTQVSPINADILILVAFVVAAFVAVAVSWVRRNRKKTA